MAQKKTKKTAHKKKTSIGMSPRTKTGKPVQTAETSITRSVIEDRVSAKHEPPIYLRWEVSCFEDKRFSQMASRC